MSTESSESDAPGRKRLKDLSRGAITLLAIAQENDRRKKIATNASLRVALEYVAKLRVACAQDDRKAICELLAGREIPGKWFEFCVALVDAIESRIEELKDPEETGFSLQTDFDRSVYLALGQTMADVTRQYRKGRLTLEISTADTMTCLSKASAIGLQQLLIKNYVGNILQELFDSCKVRLTARSLPRETEADLREKDADVVARSVFAVVGDGSAASAEDLMGALRRLLAEIWQLDAVSE